MPVYNEKENLTPLVEQILQAVMPLKTDWELILVDDGSNDGSSKLISQLAQENSHIEALHFSRNYGQTAALAAGVDNAQGEIIVTLDADLQNDPSDIPVLIKTLQETKSDIVSGWRKNRHDPFLRAIFSHAANWLICQTTGLKLHDIGCTLKAYRREVFDDLSLYGEMHRFIPALAVAQGFRVTEIPVKHHPRTKGQSKYGLSRTIKVFLDLLTVKFFGSYQTKPIYVFGGGGLVLLFLGLLAGLFVLIRKILFSGVWVSPMLFITILFFIVGVQFILMGLLAEIQIRTWFESSQKKPYIIKKLKSQNSSPGLKS